MYMLGLFDMLMIIMIYFFFGAGYKVDSEIIGLNEIIKTVKIPKKYKKFFFYRNKNSNMIFCAFILQVFGYVLLILGIVVNILFGFRFLIIYSNLKMPIGYVCCSFLVFLAVYMLAIPAYYKKSKKYRMNHKK